MNLFLTTILTLLCASTSAGTEDGTCSSKTKNCAAEAFSFPEIDLSLNELEQDDPKLIEVLRERYLVPPAGKNVPYNWSKPSVTLRGQYGQPLEIDEIFQGKKGGFFVEAGAYDGEKYSNSLLFESQRDWTGLLVEPNKEVFLRLLTKNRKAWLFPACLSTKTTPEVVTFENAGLLGGIVNNGVHPVDGQYKPDVMEKVSENLAESGLKHDTEQLQCFPLYSILKALDRTEVDYLSLDIEGAEYPVLKSFPFDKLDITLLEIESNHLGSIFPGSLTFLEKYLERSGYEFHTSLEIDRVYVKKSKKAELKL